LVLPLRRTANVAVFVPLGHGQFVCTTPFVAHHKFTPMTVFEHHITSPSLAVGSVASRVCARGVHKLNESTRSTEIRDGKNREQEKFRTELTFP